MKCLSFLLLIVLAPLVQLWALTGSVTIQSDYVGKLAINEIMFDAPEGSCEYVEIANLSDESVDLSDFCITTRSSAGELNRGNVFPSGSVVSPFSYIALCEDSAIVTIHHSVPDTANVRTCAWSQALNNQSKTLFLTSPSRRVIYDSVCYDVGWHHPIIVNPKGVALEKIYPEFESMDARSWHSASMASNYGTPGYANSQLVDPDTQLEAAEILRLDPKAFSPDGDGWEDVCVIHYQLPAPGYVANAYIYTPSGSLVAHVLQNAILEQKGSFTWNGTTRKGQNANVGVYVLFYEAFDADTGDLKRHKCPIVVSAR